MGAVVDEIAVYRTVQSGEEAPVLIDELRTGAIDMVTFTSSSTVRNFKALLPADLDPALMERVAVACIGDITAETAAQLGFRVDITAEVFTIGGLCDAIERYYRQP
jgi:uroporphyrinogen III methyltransferase/synthase